MEKGKFKDKTEFVRAVKSVGIAGDVLITDPCYLAEGLDDLQVLRQIDEMTPWQNIVSGMGLSAYAEHSTLFGDWSCTVFRVTKRDRRPLNTRAIGAFSADSGMVCVCDYREVCSANPHFGRWSEDHPWCACVVRDFAGTVSLEIYKNTFLYEGRPCAENELRVHGIGKIRGRRAQFMSYQTGL